MFHEPSGLVAHAEHAVNLMGADAFLAGRHQVNGRPPLRKRNLGALENRAHRDRELLFAIAAIIETGACRFAFNAADLAEASAMRTDRAVRPHKRLDSLASYIVVSESFGLKIGFGHRSHPL